ncbi:hypothetical protein [Methylorubrum zatmanii]|uniref:Uncharacterized protein n=1 Tax=Methylorubrum zatmanii TaxID=29429 RepID=A0ABW1WNN7_9HYPH|nr:hypothetical protein [Methylorubrum zatmanii]
MLDFSVEAEASGFDSVFIGDYGIRLIGAVPVSAGPRGAISPRGA